MTTYYIKTDDSDNISFSTNKLIYNNNKYEVFEISSLIQTHELNLNKYISNGLARENQNTIEYMLNHPPISVESANFRICWPQYIAFDTNEDLVGYLAPKAFNNSISLNTLINERKANLSSQWEVFLENTKRSCELRLTLCANLAHALASVTDINQYALSPENILITPDAKVSLVELDSMLMNKKLNPSFSFDSSALVGYLPAEAVQGAIDTTNNSVARFSLAVIMYQLMFRVHPYDATFKPPYAELSLIQDKIEKDLFVHGEGKNHVLDLPEEHKAFDTLHYNLKSPFQLAFNGRHKQQRPSAKKWQDILCAAIADNSHGLEPKIVAPIIPTSSSTIPTAKPNTPPIQTSGSSPGIPTSTAATPTKKSNNLWVIAGIVIGSLILAVLVVVNLDNKKEDAVEPTYELYDLDDVEESPDYYEDADSFEEEDTAYFEPDPIGQLTSDYVYVLYERANIRSNPSITAPVVTDVPYNTRLTKTTLPPVTKGGRVWINVATANNLRGWMSSSTISQYPRTILYSKCGVNSNEVEYIVESTGVNVRSQPNKNDASVIGVIQKGEFVCPYMYVDSNDRSIGRWLGFTLTSGGTAWVAENLLARYYSYPSSTIGYQEEYDEYEEEEEVYDDGFDSEYF